MSVQVMESKNTQQEKQLEPKPCGQGSISVWKELKKGECSRGKW